MSKKLWDYLVPSYQGYSDEAPVFCGAHGVWVHTRPYGKVLDLCSGYWNVNLGHRNPKVVAAARQGFFADLFGELHEPAARLAEELCKRTGYAKVIFNTSGTDAVDSAIRVALQCSMSRYGRHKTGFLTIRHGFHGTSGITLATSGFPRRRQWIPMGFSTRVLGLWVANDEIGAIGANERLRSEQIEWGSLSGFLFEPILGVGGVRIVQQPAYKAIADKCREAGALIISDEATTGFGRTGTFLASEKLEPPRPDIICLGKAMTNGEFPLSATLLSESVWDVLDASSDEEMEKFLYGSTYAGHPSGCLAALKVLELINKPLLTEVSQKSQWLEAGLKTLQKKHPALIKNVRGCGLMWAIELPARSVAYRAWIELLKRGVRVAEEGRSIVITPPFTISYDALAFAINTMDKVFALLTKPTSK